MELLVTEVAILAPIFIVVGVLRFLFVVPLHTIGDWLFRLVRWKWSDPADVLPPWRIHRIRRASAILAVVGVLLLLLVQPIWFRATPPSAAPGPVTGASIGGLPSAEPSSQLESEITQVVTPLLRSGKVVGLVVGVVEPTGPHVFGFGRTRIGFLDALRPDAVPPPPPDGNTIFEIGSVTKVFTALMLVRLAEQGKVRLDQPIQELLPDSVSAPSYMGHPITLEHLATHRSGLPSVPPHLGITPAEWFPPFANPWSHYTRQRLHRYLSTAQLDRAPGQKVEYSNLGMGLLGHALERATGTDYATLVRRTVCEPLGMLDTHAEPVRDLRERQAHGYVTALLPLGRWRAASPAHEWTNTALAGCGSLRSSANDMVRFLNAELGLTPSDLAAAMDSTRRPRYRQGDRADVGLGWWVLYPKNGGDPIVWHNGGTGGFRSFVGMIERRQVGVVVLANSTADVDAAGIEILKTLR